MSGQTADLGIKKRQVVVVVDCGDSRAAGAIENAITKRLMREYRERGVEVRFFRVIIPGSVINESSAPEIVVLLKAELERAIDEIGVDRLDIRGTKEEGKVPFEPIVYLRGHAGISASTAEEKLVYSPSELSVDPASPVNCGMKGARDFLEGRLIPLILRKLGRVAFSDKQALADVDLEIKDRSALYRLLKSLYVIEDHAASAEDFVFDVDLKREPQFSAAFLRGALNRDPVAKNIPVEVIPVVRNYSSCKDYRIGGDPEVVSLIDDKASILSRVMASLPKDHPERLLRGSSQKPKYGLICTPGVHENPRQLLMNHLASKSGGGVIPVAGNVCCFSGSTITSPGAPLGAYKLVGFGYFVLALGVKDWTLLAEDRNAVERIRRKLELDPITSLIIREGGVQLTQLTLSDIDKELVGLDMSVDPQVDRIIDEVTEGIIRNPVYPQSPLCLPPSDRSPRSG